MQAEHIPSFPAPLVIPGHDRESMALDPRLREDDSQCPSFPPPLVIPAKAGIHASTRHSREGGNPCIHGSPPSRG
jgi:hypothetical protein